MENSGKICWNLWKVEKSGEKDHLCNKCIDVLELIVPASARKVKAFPLLNSVQ